MPYHSRHYRQQHGLNKIIVVSLDDASFFKLSLTSGLLYWLTILIVSFLESDAFNVSPASFTLIKNGDIKTASIVIKKYFLNHFHSPF
jgi:hypothetical protein